jgi:hypothetical protein
MLAVGLGTLLAGCASTKFATLSDGACKAFPRPEYQVKGATRYDQKWVDETTEAGVAGCGWNRPAHRPTYLNPMPVKAPIAAPAPWPDAVPMPAKKPSFFNRLRSRFHRK